MLAQRARPAGGGSRAVVGSGRWSVRAAVQKQASTTQQPEQPGTTVMDYLLQEAGFSSACVQSAVARHQQLASTSLEHRVIPALAYLRGELGIGPEELQRMLLRCPQLLGYHVDQKMVPATGFLTAPPPSGLALSQQQAVWVIQRFPQLLGYDVKGHLVPHLAYLKSLGVAEHSLPQLVLARPGVLGVNIERIAKHLLRYAGVPRKQVGSLLASHPHDYGLWKSVVARDLPLPSTMRDRASMALQLELEEQAAPDGGGPGSTAAEDGSVGGEGGDGSEDGAGGDASAPGPAA